MKKSDAIPPLSDKQILNLLAHLASDAAACGACEVFLGHPSADRYEFSADGKRYQGAIHNSVYPRMVEHLLSVKRVRFCPEEKPIHELSLSLTPGEHQPIVFLTWSTQDSVPESMTETDSDQAQKTLESEKSIFVIDDDPKFVRLLVPILERKNWAVRSFPNSEDALDALATTNEQPDLIICDLHMPNQSGADFLKDVRKDSQKLPVLILTSDEDPQIEAKLALLGASAFVKKSEDPRILVAWCQNLTSMGEQLSGELQ